MSHELRQAREALSLRTSELEGLRRESAQQSDELSNKHQLMVNNEREKYLQVCMCKRPTDKQGVGGGGVEEIPAGVYVQKTYG